MPRFYFFTVLFSMIAGVILYVGLMKGFDVGHVILLIILTLLTYVNEKKALFENLLNNKVRRIIGILFILFILFLLVYLVLLSPPSSFFRS